MPALPFDGGGLIFSAEGSAVGSDGVAGVLGRSDPAGLRFFFPILDPKATPSADFSPRNCLRLVPGVEPGMGDGGLGGSSAAGLLGAGRERDSRNPVVRLERADCLASNSSLSRLNCISSLSMPDAFIFSFKLDLGPGLADQLDPNRRGCRTGVMDSTATCLDAAGVVGACK
jgi:hypothetical protein